VQISGDWLRVQQLYKLLLVAGSAQHHGMLTITAVNNHL
jgi:hypothetical protein